MCKERGKMIAAFSRGLRKSSWQHTFTYELEKLTYCLNWLRLHGDFDDENEIHLHLEGFLLHFRNLANFLSGSGGSKRDLSLAYSGFTRKCGFPPERVKNIRAQS